MKVRNSDLNKFNNMKLAPFGTENNKQMNKYFKRNPSWNERDYLAM